MKDNYHVHYWHLKAIASIIFYLYPEMLLKRFFALESPSFNTKKYKTSRPILKRLSALKCGKINCKLHLLPFFSNISILKKSYFLKLQLSWWFGTKNSSKKIFDTTFLALNQLQISKSYWKPIQVTIFLPPEKNLVSKILTFSVLNRWVSTSIVIFRLTLLISRAILKQKTKKCIF